MTELSRYLVNVEFVLNVQNEAEAILTVENFCERFPHVLVDGTDGVTMVGLATYLGDAASDGAVS